VKIRPLEDSDQQSVVTLLTEGFMRRNYNYWMNCWRYLQSQFVPSDQPRFGWGMEQEGVLVGVILNLWRPQERCMAGRPVANLSSWYVKPEYRSFAAMLLARASRDPNVTYLNVSAAKPTVKICEAFGFQMYSRGQALAIPLLSVGKSSSKVFRFGTQAARLSKVQTDLVESHLAFGCVALVGEIDGQQTPLLFVKRKVRGYIPALQLIYTENDQVIRRLIHSLGFELLKLGQIFVILDADEKLDYAVSKFFADTGARYFKGPAKPRAGDMSYTEIPAFGL
jgi:hypothetical protein